MIHEYLNKFIEGLTMQDIVIGIIGIAIIAIIAKFVIRAFWGGIFL